MEFELSHLLFIVVFCLAVVMFFRFTRKRRAEYAASISMEQMLDILHTAMLKRSSFSLSFPVQGMQNRTLSGPCVQIDDNTLMIDPNLDYYVPAWTEQPVEVYFALVTEKQTISYTFSTRIKGGADYAKRKGIVLQIPIHLHTKQRRSFVRFTPPVYSLLQVHGWLMTLSVLENAVPEFLPLPDIDIKDTWQLDNISAGGMRFYGPLGMSDNIAEHKEMLFHLVLSNGEDKNGEEKPPLALWIKADIVHLQKDEHRLAISLQFVSWALGEEAPSSLAWFGINQDHGLPPLASWVLLTHLAQSAKTKSENLM